ncbi:MAG TPA: rhomboid family intramembrane serine protease [Nitrospirota bacterium]
MIPLRDINPTRTFPVITISLIVLNIAAFVYELTLGAGGIERFLSSFALVPRRLFSPEVSVPGAIPASATLITSMFLHGGFLHLAGNMLYLWIFGNNIEDAMGKVRFIVFYLLCGALASYAHAFMNSSSLTPLIGASGAISGVLGAYALLYPRARVVTLVLIGFYVRTVEVPALIVLGLWIVLQFLNALLAGSAAGGVAWYAHISGFVLGGALIGLFKRAEVPLGGGRTNRYL